MSLPTVSLITVTDAWGSRVPFHEDLAQSINSQQGVDIQWLIAHPHTEASRKAVRAIENTVAGNGVSVIEVLAGSDLPVGARRNKALAIATGEYLANVDDDDFLIGRDSLSRRIEALQTDGVVWAAGSMVDYHFDDGSYREWPTQLAAGTYELGVGFLPTLLGVHVASSLHTSTIVSRTSTIREVGGWHATLPQAEDLYLTYQLSTYDGDAGTKGVMLGGEHVLAYRKHGHQMTSAPGYRERDEAIVEELLREFRSKGQ